MIQNYKMVKLKKKFKKMIEQVHSIASDIGQDFLVSYLATEVTVESRGGHLYLKLDIIRVKGLSKHTLNTYFSGMKRDPKYAFLHAFFLIWASCPFQNLSIWSKTYPFFQFCTFLHP